ncbi:MAG: outer membrane beta-barrel protein [Candidatus Cryptobacteroides sp.]
MMKKFSTFLLVASLLLAGGKASAQTWTAAGGFTTFTLSGSDVSGSLLDEIPAMPGFYFGASYDYAFSAIDGLTVEPGAYFLHYGKEYSFGPAKRSYHANYLSVPVNIKYRIPMNAGFDLCVLTGPRFNLGVGGNMFSKGESYPGLKLFDAQWGVGASALIADAIMVRLGYDFGLNRCIRDNADLGIVSAENIKAFRNTFLVSVGFAF